MNNPVEHLFRVIDSQGETHGVAFFVNHRVALTCYHVLEWSKAYLQGLLGNTPRKNVERMALELGEKVRSMQYFIGQRPWKPEPVIGIHQGLDHRDHQRRQQRPQCL